MLFKEFLISWAMDIYGLPQRSEALVPHGVLLGPAKGPERGVEEDHEPDDGHDGERES